MGLKDVWWPGNKTKAVWWPGNETKAVWWPGNKTKDGQCGWGMSFVKPYNMKN